MFNSHIYEIHAINKLALYLLKCEDCPAYEVCRSNATICYIISVRLPKINLSDIHIEHIRELFTLSYATNKLNKLPYEELECN